MPSDMKFESFGLRIADSTMFGAPPKQWSFGSKWTSLLTWGRYLGLTVLLTASGCGIVETTRQGFIVRVDSIEAPYFVSGAEEFVAQFSGVIGPDLCSQISDIVRRREADLLEVTFRGERQSRGNCGLMPALLQHEELVVRPYALPFTVRVLQPNGTVLEHIVDSRSHLYSPS